MGKKVIYSDGDVESVILQNLDNPENFKEIYERPGAVFHNFATCRENLINWYPFKDNAKVLEIGAGMGAITGCLCDKCASVVAIEESPRRAEIIRKRHKNHTNLQVISDDVYQYSFKDKFDYVLLIGVLEYVGINNTMDNPYVHLLKKINELLSDDGVLLLAIENKYGLKYWCGAAEDHTSIPFESLNGYEMENITGRYEKSGVKTFSRQELIKMFRDSGFEKERFYYPLPDYKFPSAIFTDECIPKEDHIRAIKFYYPQESELIADEKKLYNDVIENDVFPFFANSFLVEVTKSELSEEYVKFASYKRDYKETYNVGTIIYNDNKVQKNANNERAIAHLKNAQLYIQELYDKKIPVLMSTLENSKKMTIPYCDALLGVEVANEMIAMRNEIKLIELLNQLKEHILLSSNTHDGNPCSIEGYDFSSEIILDNAYIDMTLINCFYINQQLVFFDQEWKCSNLPLKFVLYRSIKHCQDLEHKNNNLRERLYQWFNIGEEMQSAFEQYETMLLTGMMDEVNCRVFDPMMYHEGLTMYPQSRKAVAELYCKIEDMQREVDSKEIDIEQKNTELEAKNTELEAKNIELEAKNTELEAKNTEIFNYELLRQKQDVELQNKDVIISNQHGHIEQLLEVDRHYQNIINSCGWKIVSFPGRVIEKILPVGTPRRQRVSLMVKYVKAFNWNNIKFVCEAFKKGGFKQVKKELNDFEYRMSGVTEFPMETPEIVESDEIKSLDECEKLIFKKYQSPTVSIVIPVYNQFTYTYNCLKSILQNSGEVDYEIIIADDVSTDLTTRLSEVAENINIVRNKENQRFLRNCNNAAKHAKGKYILFLNNDTQVQENWLQPLVDLIERDDTIGMVGSKLIYPDGTLQEAGGIIWGNGNAWNYGNGQNPANPEFNYVKEVDYISGAAIMIRTSLWKEIGGFDEYFAPAYCEDSDLAFEVRKHGYKLMYQPLSVVVHFEGKSNGTDLNSGVKQYQVDNSKKLQEKWKAEFAKQSPTEDDLFHAKDRSQGKKTILVVDHYVPQFDKDAGSKTTWQYLKMFVRKGYNVKFIGDNFYQHEPYCTALQQEGIEVLYGPWYAQNYKQWIIDNQDNIDFVYLNRPHITEKYIDFLKEETNIKCIYYGHDLHFLRLMREYELNGDDKVLQESEEWRKKEFDIMKKAAINYYPSYIEVDEIHKIDNNIPAKAITAYVYEEFLENINMDFAKKEGLLFVGGFGHPPNADAVAWFVENVYPLIRKKQDIPFIIVGSNAPDSIKKLDGKNGIVVKGFVSEEELAELYDTCKIVVVPLRYGAGVKGKVVEALYNGSPMVSTTVGIEGIQGAEEFMEVSDDATEFAEKVLGLYNNHDKLAETVKAYQSYVKEHNSIDAVWDIVKEDFQ